MEQTINSTVADITAENKKRRNAVIEKVIKDAKNVTDILKQREQQYKRLNEDGTEVDATFYIPSAAGMTDANRKGFNGWASELVKVAELAYREGMLTDGSEKPNRNKARDILTHMYKAYGVKNEANNEAVAKACKFILKCNKAGKETASGGAMAADIAFVEQVINKGKHVIYIGGKSYTESELVNGKPENKPKKVSKPKPKAKQPDGKAA